MAEDCGLSGGRIGRGLIGTAQEIVCAGAVEIRQLQQYVGGDVPFAHFIVGIADLGALQIGGQVLLQQVPILPQVADASIHGFAPPFRGVTKSIDKTNCFIDR